MKRFKISSCTANYGTADLTKILQRLHELEYDGAELTTMYHCIPSETNSQRRTAISQTARQLNLEISGLHYIFPPGGSMVSDDSSERDAIAKHAESVIQLAHDLECKIVVVGGSKQRSVPAHMDRKLGVSRVLEVFARIAKSAEKHGVIACFEAHNRYESNLANTLEECSGYVDYINSPALKIAGDTYHMNIEEKSLEGAIVAAGSRIGHMHLPDSHRLAPGGGHIDFGKVLTALRQVNFTGYLSFEMFGITPEMMWLPTFELCDDEVRKGIKYIRQIEASLVP
jgi:sugar phosphate isomerase/epimerase